MRLLPRDAWEALPVAWLEFIALGAVVKAGLRRVGPGAAWRPQAILNVALLALSLTAAFVEGIPIRQLGFCRPQQDVWGASVGGGLLLGGLATQILLVSRVRGLRSTFSGYSFGSIVVWVWIVSSVSEEVFCRGWFQTSTDGARFGLAALLPSALLFGGMHLSLLFAGVDLASVLVVVAATSALGGLAAWARAGSGSLYPAIAAHVAFNLGGALGGIAHHVLRRPASPPPPSPGP